MEDLAGGFLFEDCKTMMCQPWQNTLKELRLWRITFALRVLSGYSFAEMRRITGTEKGGIALASVFIIGGLCMMFHPMEMFVLHPGHGRYNDRGSRPPEHVTKQGARAIGVGAILFGVGFASFVLYRPRQ